MRELRYATGDLLVVSGLPGSGKSTLMSRVLLGRGAAGGPVWRVDSQDTRDRWQRMMPDWVGYPVYRPLVRLAHYAGLRRAVRSGASVVVHDCGTLPWVRHWLARGARRRGAALHLVLLDVDPGLALAGQAARGRRVSAYAFRRHRAAAARLRTRALTGSPPPGCASTVLLDRAAAGALAAITFDSDETDETSDTACCGAGCDAACDATSGTGCGAACGTTCGTACDAPFDPGRGAARD